MAVLFCGFAVVLLLVCAGLSFTSKRSLGGWLLVLFPAALCLGLLRDLARGAQKLGQAGYDSDLTGLLPLFGFLILALLAAFRPNWRWLFWSTWFFAALFCAVTVYLTFFWKMFS